MLLCKLDTYLHPQPSLDTDVAEGMTVLEAQRAFDGSLFMPELARADRAGAVVFAFRDCPESDYNTFDPAVDKEDGAPVPS